MFYSVTQLTLQNRKHERRLFYAEVASRCARLRAAYFAIGRGAKIELEINCSGKKRHIEYGRRKNKTDKKVQRENK